MKGPIVVGTDGSDTAAVALAEAIAMAKAFDLSLHVVCAYKPLPTKSLPSEFADAVHPDSRPQAVLDDAASRARQAGVSVEPHSVTGDPADAILDVAEQVDAGLIVVGNKGIGSMRRFMLGNVPSKIVHHAPCSTHVVHTTA
jgi:nucleotide-binding universal stress UspA family protein